MPRKNPPAVSTTTEVPRRLRALSAALAKGILELPRVLASPGGSFRIGRKIFARQTITAAHIRLEFKLSKPEAKLACSSYAFVRPMKFGNMGDHGWIEAHVNRKSQVRAVLTLLRVSRSLYRP